MFGRKRVKLEHVAALKEEITELRAALSVQSAANEAQVTRAAETDLAERERTYALVADQDRRLVDMERQIADVRDLTNSAAARVDEVSQTISNQLHEISRQTDALADRAVTPESIEELRAAQARFANELARYEIAMRADLAALGEQLRRPR